MIKVKSIKQYIRMVIKNPKKVIRKIDEKLLGGKIASMKHARKEKKRMALEKYIAEHAEEYYDQQVAAEIKKGADLGTNDYAVRDILLAQFHEGEGAFHDIAVRMLAIEQYYGKNSIGFDLYSKMQERHFGYGTFWMERFKKLVHSYETNEMEAHQPIDVDKNLRIIDGANRLALALYHDEEFMPVRVHETTIDREWGYNYFRELNFTEVDVRKIHEKAISIFERCKYQYVGVIWPPAYHLRDEIENEINTYLNNSQYPPPAIG